jgi:Family of unknown function (DUF6152)
MTTKGALLVGILWLVSMFPLRAHHSVAAEFDINSPVTVTGSVTKVDWMNPHVWFYIDVKAEVGAGATWGMEMGSPNGLMRAGWTRTSMAIGEMVTVEGYRAKDGTTTANARAVTLTKTGKRLFPASSARQ